MTAWIIYGLRSPSNASIRYVGITTMPARRLRDHIYRAERQPKKYPVHRWIRALLAKDEQPVMIGLDSGEGIEAGRQRERDIIATLKPSGRLLNATDGGLEFGAVSQEARKRAGIKLKNRCFSPEHRRRISEAKTGKPRSDAAACSERAKRMAASNRGKKMILSSEERQRRSELGRIAGVQNNRKRWDAITEQDYLQFSANAKRKITDVWAARTPEQRAAIALKAVETRRRNTVAKGNYI